MIYKVEVSNGQGWRVVFESTSRNAKKHLIDHFGDQDGARCTVRTKKGKVVCECRYSAEFGYYYAETE